MQCTAPRPRFRVIKLCYDQNEGLGDQRNRTRPTIFIMAANVEMRCGMYKLAILLRSVLKSYGRNGTSVRHLGKIGRGWLGQPLGLCALGLLALLWLSALSQRDAGRAAPPWAIH